MEDGRQIGASVTSFAAGFWRTSRRSPYGLLGTLVTLVLVGAHGELRVHNLYLDHSTAAGCRRNLRPLSCAGRSSLVASCEVDKEGVATWKQLFGSWMDLFRTEMTHRGRAGGTWARLDRRYLSIGREIWMALRLSSSASFGDSAGHLSDLCPALVASASSHRVPKASPGVGAQDGPVAQVGEVRGLRPRLGTSGCSWRW